MSALVRSYIMKPGSVSIDTLTDIIGNFQKYWRILYSTVLFFGTVRDGRGTVYIYFFKTWKELEINWVTSEELQNRKVQHEYETPNIWWTKIIFVFSNWMSVGDVLISLIKCGFQPP
jgi:hypothetical protein